MELDASAGGSGARLQSSAAADLAPGGPRFFADAMLGRLARWLRMAGYDTRHDPDVDDADLARIALEEGRVVLTRDRLLPEQCSVGRAVRTRR